MIHYWTGQHYYHPKGNSREQSRTRPFAGSFTDAATNQAINHVIPALHKTLEEKADPWIMRLGMYSLSFTAVMGALAFLVFFSSNYLIPYFAYWSALVPFPFMAYYVRVWYKKPHWFCSMTTRTALATNCVLSLVMAYHYLVQPQARESILGVFGIVMTIGWVALLFWASAVSDLARIRESESLRDDVNELVSAITELSESALVGATNMEKIIDVLIDRGVIQPKTSAAPLIANGAKTANSHAGAGI